MRSMPCCAGCRGQDIHKQQLVHVCAADADYGHSLQPLIDQETLGSASLYTVTAADLRFGVCLPCGATA